VVALLERRGTRDELSRRYFKDGSFTRWRNGGDPHVCFLRFGQQLQQNVCPHLGETLAVSKGVSSRLVCRIIISVYRRRRHRDSREISIGGFGGGGFDIVLDVGKHDGVVVCFAQAGLGFSDCSPWQVIRGMEMMPAQSGY